MSSPNPITLREVSRDNLDEIFDLDVTETQREHVASNAVSLAQALIYSDVAWYRAIYNGETPVGFLMTNESPGEQPYLWRLMIDQKHQGHGHGKHALSILCERLAKLRALELHTSCVAGVDGPLAFYERLGFTPTGETDEDGEIILKRSLNLPV
jgi:diamine N-acetyltransferase